MIVTLMIPEATPDVGDVTSKVLDEIARTYGGYTAVSGLGGYWVGRWEEGSGPFRVLSEPVLRVEVGIDNGIHSDGIVLEHFDQMAERLRVGLVQEEVYYHVIPGGTPRLVRSTTIQHDRGG
jgi:hypothetical protein